MLCQLSCGSFSLFTYYAAPLWMSDRQQLSQRLRIEPFSSKDEQGREDIYVLCFLGRTGEPGGASRKSSALSADLGCSELNAQSHLLLWF